MKKSLSRELTVQDYSNQIWQDRGPVRQTPSERPSISKWRLALLGRNCRRHQGEDGGEWDDAQIDTHCTVDEDCTILGKYRIAIFFLTSIRFFESHASVQNCGLSWGVF
ncbi:hypothetical protein AALO_G00278210 [Alosa alosa]|uniref:Uncharacterized protein n=1 Tax=Alosa alosa TaxID=278164 RepID=A0AAV6FM34_9TELE|nr:hypothetical protein AALO_G00278210 [Alosa alosa]